VAFCIMVSSCLGDTVERVLTLAMPVSEAELDPESML